MTDTDLPSLETLADRYYDAGDKTRKGWTYLRSYTRLLEARRNEPLRVLELGVFSGASLLSGVTTCRARRLSASISWTRRTGLPARTGFTSFKAARTIPRCSIGPPRWPGGAFDLIVDDASHIGYLTKRSLHYLLPRSAGARGWYVIEDFGTGYLGAYPDGGISRCRIATTRSPAPPSSAAARTGWSAFVKQLVDLLMQELMTGVRSHLSIERVIVETNIVFIEKSLQPGGPLPDPAQMSTVAPEPDAGADRLDTLTGTLAHHAEGYLPV